MIVLRQETYVGKLRMYWLDDWSIPNCSMRCQKVVGTTHSLCIGSYECSVAEGSFPTRWVQGYTNAMCELSITHD